MLIKTNITEYIVQGFYDCVSFSDRVYWNCNFDTTLVNTSQIGHEICKHFQFGHRFVKTF